jgi:hypothetical protein
MSFNIVYPVAMPIDGKDFKDAAKRFIKLNHFMNIEQMVLADQMRYMQANVNYLNNNHRRKASIQLMPIDASMVPTIVPGMYPGVIGFSSTNPRATYPAPMIVSGPMGSAVSGLILGAQPSSQPPAAATQPSSQPAASQPTASQSAASQPTASQSAASQPAASQSAASPMGVSPMVVTANRQLLPVKFAQIGTNVGMINGRGVPFGSGVFPGGIVGGPGVVVGGPMGVAPIRFGPGL